METNQTQPETNMNRAGFLRSLGLSSAALMSIYCASGLVACGSSDTATPTPTPPPGGGNTSTGVTGNTEVAKGVINFTIDLTNANYTKLATAGGFAPVGDIVVANAKGTYVAIGRICTHAAGNLNYVAASDTFVCDNHGGVFNTNGTVKTAPPTTAVKAYKAAVTGTSLTITA